MMPNELDRARILNAVLERLGADRALEANSPHIPPIANPLGDYSDGLPIVGVDLLGGPRPYRARIRYCSALQGRDVRITLLRTDCVDEAVWAYRYAHVALYGSASWAANDDIMEFIAKARR